MLSNYSPDEKSHRLPSFLVALAIYSALLALLVLWEIKYEIPAEPMGIEVNFGEIGAIGHGSNQTLNKASAANNSNEVKPSGKGNDLPKKSENIVKNEVKKAASSPPPKVKPTPEKILTSEADDHKVTAKDKVTPVKTPTKVTPTTTSNSPAKPTTTPSNSTPKPTPVPERKVDEGSLFGKGKGAGGGTNGTTGTKTGEGGNNNGNGPKGSVGDQGDPNGKLDGGSMMGKPGKGGSGGSSISGFSGWRKGKLSLPKDNSDETGKIVFQVKVDDQGEVISISVLEKTVSPSVVDFYKRQVSAQMARLLDADGEPPKTSTGVITIFLNN